MADEPEVLFGKWLVALRKAVENPVRTLKRIGALVTSRSQMRFTTQRGLDGSEWPERMTPNIPGILEDLERGAGVKDRRFQGRPALIDYGSMRNSINWQLVSLDTVEIGTPDQKASAHHNGAARVIPITQKMKDGLAELLGKFRRKAKRAAKKGGPMPGNDPTSLAFLLRRDTFEFEIIPRQFIGLDEQDEADVYEIIRGSFLRDALGESTS